MMVIFNYTTNNQLDDNIQTIYSEDHVKLNKTSNSSNKIRKPNIIGKIRKLRKLKLEKLRILIK